MNNATPLQSVSDSELEARHVALKQIKDELLANTTAPLWEYRKTNGYHPVIGEGSHAAKIMFVGEAPGENEAKQGRPFCGAAGKFLDVILEHLQLERKLVYITNIVKDRPPNNRDPLPQEIDFYATFLDRQIEIIKPSCLVTLGRYSMGCLLPKCGLDSELAAISQLHGKQFKGTIGSHPVTVVTLYHPAVALYNGSMRQVLLKDAEVLLQSL